MRFLLATLRKSPSPSVRPKVATGRATIQTERGKTMPVLLSAPSVVLTVIGKQDP
jgi:hypothetical protein